LPSSRNRKSLSIQTSSNAFTLSSSIAKLCMPPKAKRPGAARGGNQEPPQQQQQQERGGDEQHLALAAAAGGGAAEDVAEALRECSRIL
jgi:hypothetical protein